MHSVWALTAVIAGSILMAIGLPSDQVAAQGVAERPIYRNFSGPLDGVITNLYGGDGITLQGSDVFSHAAHFIGDSLAQFNKLSLGVRDLTFPILNPQVGVRFKYDPVLDEFVPTENSLSASAFAFDAETVGKGELHLGMAFSVRKFDEIGGAPLDRLEVDLMHVDLGDNGSDLPCIGGPPGACYAFERDVIRLSIDLEIEEEMLALTGAYGLTDRMDVSVFLPILRTTVGAFSSATVVENPTRVFFPVAVHSFGGDSGSAIDAVRAQRTGIGDTVVRLNYGVITHRDDAWNVNAGIDVRMPTGRANNLQGLPEIGIKPRIIASRDVELGFGVFRPHVNIAYGFNSGVHREQIIDYAVGGSFIFEWSSNQAAMAIGADFLGKNVVTRRDEMGDDQFDLSLGLSYSFRQGLNAYYNVLLPLNEAGLRPNAQHVFGLQVRF